MNEVLPRYVSQTRYKSFVRQLNMWGYICMHGGRTAPERGSYRHPCFVRGNPSLCANMVRCKIKNKNRKRRSSKNDTQHQLVSATTKSTPHQQKEPMAASPVSSSHADTVTSSAVQFQSEAVATVTPKKSDKSISQPSSLLDSLWESQLASIATNDLHATTPLDDMIAASVRDGFGYEKTQNAASPPSPQSLIMTAQGFCQPRVLQDGGIDLPDTANNADDISLFSCLGDDDGLLKEAAQFLDGIGLDYDCEDIAAAPSSPFDSLMLQEEIETFVNTNAAVSAENCDGISSHHHENPHAPAQARHEERDNYNRNERIACIVAPAACSAASMTHITSSFDGSDGAFFSASNHFCASSPHDHHQNGSDHVAPWAPPPPPSFLDDRNIATFTDNYLQSCNSLAAVPPPYRNRHAAARTSASRKRTFSINSTLDALLGVPTPLKKACGSQ